MRTELNLIYSCFIALFLACSPCKEEMALRDKQVSAKDVETMEADLMQQQAAMDSIAAMQEIEVAQQIVINQQLMDLKSKMATEESRLNAAPDSE